MRSIRIFTPQNLTTGETLVLESSAANHVARVLRCRVGDALQLFNGDGQDVQAEIIEISKKAVSVQLGKAQAAGTESPLNTHLGLCLSKGERFDWALQKATELGVSEITPLISERVEVRLPADRLQKKEQHWLGVVRSACEQCYRSVVPMVHTPVSLEHWANNAQSDLKLVLHHHQKATLADTAIPASVALLIGPEGGLSEADVALAETAGFQRWSLGPRVLRTETAPIVALTALGLEWGDLN